LTHSVSFRSVPLRLRGVEVGYWPIRVGESDQLTANCLLREQALWMK
jgi:hypothetical protein